MKTESMVVGIIEQKHIINLLQNGKRLDSRELMQPREAIIETNVVNKANGSAKVTLGETVVWCGVKAELGNPFPDTPNNGVLIVNIELNPIASPYFQSGPPRKEAIELARVCDRAIRESHVIDTDKLCVVPGEKVWIIFVDIYTISDGGNLLDASSIAAMAALASTKLPTVIIDSETNQVTKTDKLIPFPLKTWCTTMTFSKMGKEIMLLDPSLSEEKVEDLRFTVGVTENGIVSALQKGLSSSFSSQQAFELIDIAVQEGKKRIEFIKSVVSSN